MERAILIKRWHPLPASRIFRFLFCGTGTGIYAESSNAQERKIAKRLVENGFRAEPDPQGNLSLGYGCVSVQRRENWSAVARGHSRYLWAAEHYLGHNLYGRYLT